MKKIALTTAQTALLMAALTIVSKMLGFLRELVMANYYGAGMVTDAYVMAQQIPNYLLAALISAVGISYMPCFSKRYELEGPESANLFTDRLIDFQLLICAAVTVLGCVFAHPLVRFFARGFSEEAIALTVTYLRPALIASGFNVFITILGSFLQYKKVFIQPILVGYLQSLSIIAVTIISTKVGYGILGWGFALALILRAILTIAVAVKNGFTYKFGRLAEMTPLIKEVSALAIPIFLAGCVSQVNQVVDKMMASGLSEGSVSGLNYAGLVTNVILAFTVGIMTTMLYPRFSEAIVKQDFDGVGKLAANAVCLISLITIPFALGSCMFAGDAVQVLFERGAFNADATATTALAFKYYALLLPFQGVLQTLLHLFYSLKQTRLPMLCSVASVCVNIALNILLVQYMGVGGLALATSVSIAINCLLLYVCYKRRFPQHRLISGKKLLLMALFSAVSVGLARLFFVMAAPAITPARMIRLFLAVALAVAVYLLLLYLFRFEELSVIADLFGRKRSAAEPGEPDEMK